MQSEIPFDADCYDFELPAELIAQTPCARRDASRLLVAGAEGALQHRQFSQVGDYLNAGDVLVLNRTRVINARCFAQKDTGTRIEVFVLGMPASPQRTEVLLKPAKRVRAGMVLHFPRADVRVEVVSKGDQGRAVLTFADLDSLSRVLAQDGQVPLPPYIKRPEGPILQDDERYQTVFARDPGAVAAPTAGLHFSEQLLADLGRQGIEIAYVTHHVGIGTFKPLDAEDIREHRMDAEHYEVAPETASMLNRARLEGRRIVAVGSTSTRCLESCLREDGFQAGRAATDLYIFPGYRFRAVDAMVTNFHLPRSSLILLVSAFMGRARIMDIYTQAIAANYRFYSFGDAMLLLPRMSLLSQS